MFRLTGRLRPLLPWLRVIIPTVILLAVSVTVAFANVYGDRTPPRGTVPNPGTQQQELANITFPAPYNVFEFVVTCGACHGGTIDQQAGHFGNWAGSSMASATRDPIFRANQIIVNDTVKSLGAGDGAGNLCFRCHSPNGWLSGRYDPNLAGAADGSTGLHSILASTDDEGIMCETCHRAIGNVTMKRSDLNPTDPVWNMMSGISDWPHAGNAFPNGPVAGLPYGDATIQYNDGMTYAGKYAGSVDIYFSDKPIGGTPYTGQTYGIYPPGYDSQLKPKFANNGNQTFPAGKPQFNDANQEIVYNPDGSVPIHFEVPAAPPANQQNFALSLEHPTTDADGFVRTPQFCGSCHDLTVPVLNHGMPEQRTFTEWQYSYYGQSTGMDSNGQPIYNATCQSCHMPTLKHEYSDDAQVSLNADPVLAGWAPYAKDRNPNGGTTFHKLAGANRDLPQIMKAVYPEVDLEVIGAPTGNDTRIFPGMMSSRDLTWDRATRNSEVTLSNGVDVQIVQAPTLDTNPQSPTYNRWIMQVKVTNTSGHRIPSGYPDGRRFWLAVQVADANNSIVYESGYYDQAQATLYNTTTKQPFKRALGRTIDEANNAVMVYERVTGTCTTAPGGGISSCVPSPSLLNDTILFDNRIPPKGYDRAAYEAAGTGLQFITYNPTTFKPTTDMSRYGDGENWDLVTYVFDAPATANLNARATINWQSHTREFLEHLRTSDTSTLRPEGPPSIYDPNYPLTPSYLSDNIVDYYNTTQAGPAVLSITDIKSIGGQPLKDNWGGIAYASWKLTGQGAPFLAAADDTRHSAAPAAPTGVTATPVDPFSIQVAWNAAANADSYIVWIRYGADTSPTTVDPKTGVESGNTSSWDQLGIVYPTPGQARLTFLNEGLNVGKTYQYRVEAVNGKGGTRSATVVAQTTTDLPLPPELLRVVSTTASSVTLSWFDMADNEIGFIIQRQDVPAVGDFVTVATINSQTPGAPTGGNTWTDTTVQGGRTYNYQVLAYNAEGNSIPSLPVTAITGGLPGGNITLVYSILPGPQVGLVWTGATGTISGYRVERSLNPTTGFLQVAQVAGTSSGWVDTSVAASTTYSYRVYAYNNVGNGPLSNVLTLTTPSAPPPAPTNLRLPSPVVNIPVDLRWNHTGGGGLQGFRIERAIEPDAGLTPAFVQIGQVGPGARRYQDATAQPKTTYLYRVIAYNAGGPSLPSATLRVVTPGEIPQAPTNLVVAQTTRTGARVRWTDTSNNEEGFYVEYSSNGGTSWIRISVAANVQVANIPNLSRLTTYQFRVIAFNRNGQSEPSNIATGKTK